MKTTKNIARLAVTAGLTAVLGFGGVMAPAAMAFAAGTTTSDNSITIKNVAEENKDNTLKAYQIFKAKVVDEEKKGKVASDIEWSSTTIGLKVIAAIKESAEYKEIVDADRTAELADGATAPVVAEWLAKNVTGTSASSATSSEGTRVAPGDVLYEIAAAVSGNKQSVAAETAAGILTADKSWTRPNKNGDGYYLFVPDGLTDQKKPNTGTSPIFAIVGGHPVTVTEKTSIPTVNKWILNDKKNVTADSAAEGDWEKCGDSQIGQEVDYKLTGTVADNIASYTKYEYKFQDTLSRGLVVTKDENGGPRDLHVYIVNGNDKAEVKPGATNGYQPTVTTDSTGKIETLNVNFANLKAVQDVHGNSISVDAASNVVVTYKAQLTSDASYEAAGNINTVKLVYSNNPMTGDTGTSVEKKVTEHVFRLDVTKTDKETGSLLQGDLRAGFKVQVVSGDDRGSDNKWLAVDGSLVDVGDAYEFMTVDGKVYIPGLDAGKYRITETTTPKGYNTIAPIEITVTPKYGDNGELEVLTLDSNNEDMTQIGAANGATMSLTIKNKKGSGLPLTGLNGVTFTWIAGGAVLCIGVVHLIRSRKRDEGSEE